jgi:hypothetical protein
MVIPQRTKAPVRVLCNGYVTAVAAGAGKSQLRSGVTKANGFMIRRVYKYKAQVQMQTGRVLALVAFCLISACFTLKGTWLSGFYERALDFGIFNFENYPTEISWR